MADSINYFDGNEQQNAFNAYTAQLNAGGGSSGGPFQASGSGSGGGGMQYTDKELYQMQYALNQAAQVKQQALTNTQQRTDQTVATNNDYFKQLTEEASKLLAPYQALASQGSQFYMNAIGANGPAAQQASMPQASQIFKQNSIDPTNYLQSIPSWSFNQASNQATQAMNQMFGYSPAQSTQGNARFNQSNAQSRQTAQQVQQQQQSNVNPAFANNQSSFDIYKSPEELAKIKADTDAATKAKSDYDSGLSALTGKQGSYESDTMNWFKSKDAAAKATEDKIAKLRSIPTGGHLDAGTYNWLRENGFNNTMKSDGTFDLSGAGMEHIRNLQQQANATRQEMSSSKDIDNYNVMLRQQNGRASDTDKIVNPYDQQVADYKAKQAAANPTAATAGSQGAQGQLAQTLQQQQSQGPAATLQAEQLSGAPNQALQGLMSPFMAELNNKPDDDPNTILNKLIDPATGAVNSWLNSDVVKNVMDATIGAGTNAVQNGAAARGMLDSGQTLAELQKVGTNAAGQYIVPYAGQLANNVLTQGTSIANNRLSNYYSLLGKGADFANSMMQTQSAMTQGLAGQYNTLAGNNLNTMQNNASQQAIAGQSNQMSGLTNLMNQGQQAATNTASMYSNLGTNSAAQNVYGNDVYGNTQMQGANIEANRLSQFQQLQMQLDRAEQAQKGNRLGDMINGGGTLLGLGMMAAGGGL